MFDDISDSALKRRVKNHVIGREHDFFAVVQPGFEKTSGAELSSIGLMVKDGFIEGGVEFTGRLDACYSASLFSRTASRIIMRAGSFRSVNYFELERLVRSFPWELYLYRNAPLRYRVSAEKSMIYHTGKLEDIINEGINSRLDTHGTDTAGVLNTQTLLIRNSRDQCTVSLDASGDFLYKRGGGKLVNRAPLRETIAALILLEAGLGNYDLLVDPMCGSGTFSLEAAGILTGTPAAYKRGFSFMYWPCFREGAFRFIKKRAIDGILPAGEIRQKIITSDIDPAAVKITESNAGSDFGGLIAPSVSDFFSLAPGIASGRKTLIVLNPPYGKRIDETAGRSLYREIGRKIKTDFSNCGYAIIAPGLDKERELNLPCDRKIPFMNGGIKAAVMFRDAR